jgi:hypothetical protein
VYQMPELPIWRYVNLDCEQVKVMLWRPETEGDLVFTSSIFAIRLNWRNLYQCQTSGIRQLSMLKAILLVDWRNIICLVQVNLCLITVNYLLNLADYRIIINRMWPVCQ